MFGRAFFGARYFGPRYFGDGSDVVVLEIAADQQLAPITQSATGSAIVDVSASQTLAPITQSATGSTITDVHASQTLAVVTQDATLSAVAEISASQILAVIVQLATGSSIGEISASQTLDPITQDATLAPPFAGSGTRSGKRGLKTGLEPVRRPNPRVEQPRRRQPVRLPSSDDLEWLAGRRTVRPAPWQPPGDEIFAEHELPVSFHEQMQRLLDARRIDDERRRIAQQRAMARQMAARDEAEIVTLMQFL